MTMTKYHKDALLMTQDELRHKRNILKEKRNDLRELMSVDERETYPVLTHLDDLIADLTHLID